MLCKVFGGIIFWIFVFSLSLDLDGDGLLEDVSFYPHVDNAIRVFREGVEVWKGVPARWEAWKLVIADVDGDGIKELLVGVNIKTRFFPNKHRSIFVLGWNGSFAYPRWLGSHMSKPLIDFTAFNLDGLPQDELITLEETREGRRCLLVYRWVGFGFIVIWHSEPFNGGELFNDGSVVGVKFQDGGFRIVRFFNGGFLLRPYP